MGSTICRSVNISSSSRRSDLKDSRFDPSMKKKAANSKRGQVQPISNKIATLHTSFLNHTKSNISKNQHSNKEDHFLEELDCDYCKDSIQNGAIASKIANNQLTSCENTVGPNSPDPAHQDPKPPLTPFVSNSAFLSRTTRSPSDPSVQVQLCTNDERHQVPAIVHPNSVPSLDRAMDRALIHSPDHVSDNCESGMIYRSVSTIPLASDKESDNEDLEEDDNEINEILLSKAKSSSLDEGIDLKLKRNFLFGTVNDSQNVVQCAKHDKHQHKDKKKTKKKCNFCDFVKNGSGRSWNDLDKDVSMLMETVDKLSSLIAEKELVVEKASPENEKLYQIHELKSKGSHTQESASFDDADEIVEEKKVSLSFLEKLHAIDLKEKVQQLRNKRRIGISLMRTSRGKRLMVFSDGQNTYQIQVSKPQSDESSKQPSVSQDGTFQRNAPSSHNLVVKEADPRRRSPSRSRSSLSSLEPFSQGVDTLEVCDKAAARLRELLSHLEHDGDVPTSMLKKTLQYAAYVLDTVSMDETRRPKLKKQPLRPSASPSGHPDPSPPNSSSSDSGTVKSKFRSNTSTDAVPQTPKSTPKPSCNSKSAHTDESVKRVILTQVDPKANQMDEVDSSRVDPQDSLQRRLLDEEDELAEVQPDAVPSEVREWLASTFTRSQVAQKPKSDDKPKFRSVANAIRAGIMVDRIYRRLFNASTIHIASEVSTFLRGVDEWSFDVFAMNLLCPSKVLRNLSAELLNRYGLVHKFKIPVSCLDSFLFQIEQGYMKYSNPYHNNLHAADVTQTVHYMLWVTGLAQWLTDLEVFATLIAAIIHDFQHTGTTNNFHIMSGSEITMMYNDRSVLENYHISEAFKVMRKEESNIVVNLSREEYREFRTLIIEMVIATDMSTHFQQVKTLKTLLGHQEFAVDKQKGLSYILHSADISHPSKVFSLHQKWTLLLMEEFFRQGDMEKELGLAYSPLCDRNSTLIPQSQIGFIDFIVAPTMELCGDLIERVHENINALQQQSDVQSDTTEEQIEELAKDQVRCQSSMEASASTPTTANTNGANASLPTASRNTSSAPAYTRCSAPVILFKKLHRPWLKHLEENKTLWQAKAAEEAKQMAEEESNEDE